MSDTERHPAISVIVPVYNAEKFLGYCLNSLVSQTFTDYEVIIVNDGSTDGSLEICQRYAAIDARFHIISIPNGGVSNARNTAVQAATGDYLTFLDSDDALALNALELMIQAEKHYHTGLVIGNIQLVDFSKGEVLPVRLSSDYLGNERVLTKREFIERKMEIIWHTSLMEGLCCKLYVTKTWRQSGTRCPEDLSFGEDFIANMNYYNACNGVCFLNKTVYYYNNPENSASLTHQYREDLFDNKMYLQRMLLLHLGGLDAIKPYQRISYYKYVALTGMRCIEDILNKNQHLTRHDRIRMISHMLEDTLFRQCMADAEYSDARFAGWTPYICAQDVKGLLALIKRQSAMREVDSKRRKRTRFNYILGMPLRVFGNKLKRYGIGHKLLQVDKSLERIGFRKMFYQLFPHVRVRNARSLEVQHIIQTVVKDVRNFIYLSEQHTRRDLMRHRINELRQSQKILLVGTSEHSNIGDAAITLAEQYLLKRVYPEYFQMEFSTYEIDRQYAFLQAIACPEDVICLSGGGNLGSQYAAEEELRRRVISDFPCNKIIILPQTIYFSNDAHGHEELERTSRVYNAHADLTLFLRGKESLAFAKKHFPHTRSCLMPDCALYLRRDYAFDRSGVLLCLRDDGEGVFNDEKKRMIRTSLETLGMPVHEIDNVAQEDISREERADVVNAQLKRFAHHRAVVTDRLHGVIFAAVTHTPCVALGLGNQKIREFVDTFMENDNTVQYVGNEINRLPAAVRAMCALDEPWGNADYCDMLLSIRSASESL